MDNWREALRRAAPHLLTAAALAAIGIIFYLPNTQTLLDYEDGVWLRDEFPLYRGRLLQRFVLSGLLLPLLGHRVGLYYVFCTGLHILCAFLVHLVLCQVFAAYKTRGNASVQLAHLGGTFSGMLFLSYGARNLTYLSAISYQLQTLFSLLSLIMLLAFFRRQLLRYWVLAALMAAGAMAAHSYTFGLPILFLCMEVMWRRNRTTTLPKWTTLWRYGVLMLVLCGFIAFGWAGLTGNKLPAARLVRHFTDPGLIWVSMLHFINYLEVMAADLVVNARGFFSLASVPYPSTGIFWSADRIFCGAVVCGLLVLAVITMIKRTALGAGAAGAIFVVVWSGITLHQTLFIGYSGDSNWRYYFNIAGLCIFSGFLLVALLGRLFRRLPRPSHAPVAGALMAVILIVSVSGDSRALETAGEILRGEARLRSAYAWELPGRCSSSPRMEREELMKVAAGEGDLACRDLSGMDLSELKLNGVDLRWANLTGARLTRTDLKKARLSGASLTFADLKEARLGGADLRGANLTGAGLQNADLTGAQLDRSIWVGAFWFSAHWDGLADGEVQRLIKQKTWKPGAKGGANGRP